MILTLILAALVLIFTNAMHNVTREERRRRLESQWSAHYPPAFTDPDKDIGDPLDVDGYHVNYGKVMKALREVLNTIYARYELDGVGKSFLLTAQNMDSKTFDRLMYKFAWRLVEPNMEKRSYLMIFGGSSVTAGHDNYYKDSYPLVVRRLLTPIFDMMGIDLKVRNIAQGANDCMPYTYCYESMGGRDPDWVGWEQSYNCGNDVKVFELLGRIAGQSKNRAVVYYSASGAFKPDKCAPSKTQPARSRAEWDFRSEGIKPWNPAKKDIESWKKSLFYFRSGGSSSRRFDSYLGPNYEGLGSFGFNVWMGNKFCKVLDHEGKVIKTGCSAADIGIPCAEDPEKKGMKFMTHEAAEYGAGRGANWHPPAGFHLLRGEAITFVLGLALMDALYHVTEALDKGATTDTLADTFKGKFEELTALPMAPKTCEPYECKNKPTCYSSYYPHYQKEFTLNSAVVGKTGWVYSGQLQSSEFHTKWGYRDSRPDFHFDGAAARKLPSSDVYTDIHLRLDVDDPKVATLCGKLVDVTFYLHEDGQKDVQSDGNGNAKYVLPSNLKRYQHKATPMKEMQNTGCIHLEDLPAGNHVLTIRGNMSSPIASKLTHIISWPGEKYAKMKKSKKFGYLKSEKDDKAVVDNNPGLFPGSTGHIDD